MFTVASLSKWHPHENRYTPELMASSDCRVKYLWDENAARGEAWSKQKGIPFEGDLRVILADAEIDGVVITAPTAMHKDIIIKAADAGKHVFTEKTLALTYRDALEIKQAVERNHITFGIAYIRCTTGKFMFAKRVADSGLLGDITTVRVRNGHNQALNGMLPDYWFDPAGTGGGAMTDLGCHQIYLLDWLFGSEPQEISSTFSFYTGRAVEDSGVVTGLYNGGKTVAIYDSSFTSFYCPYTFELYGTLGTLIARIDKPFTEVYLQKDAKTWFGEYGCAVETKITGETARYMINDEVFPDAPSPLRDWIDACVAGTPAKFGIESAVRLSRVIEAANISFATGKKYVF